MRLPHALTLGYTTVTAPCNAAFLAYTSKLDAKDTSVPIALNDLTVNFAHLDRDTLLSEWRWLISDRKLPMLLTALGDAFVQDVDDGTVHLLSSGEGALKEVAANVAEFQTLLSNRDFVIEHFVPDIIVELRSAGHVLEPRQLYGYKVPPHLGGAYAPDNLEPTDIAVHFSLLGQMHRQTQGMVPGTPIGSIELK